MAPVVEREMAKERKNTPVRIGSEAIRWARIASGYTGESMAEYITRTVEEQARKDVDRLHDKTMGEERTEGKTTTKRSAK